MSHVRLPRGVVKDVPFLQYTSPGGNLTDGAYWVDGLTAEQWATAKVYTQPDGAGTDVTSLVVKDIAADAISSATHKHPVGSTGLWRKSTGTFRVRVQPSNALAFGDYYVRAVFYPSAGNSFPKDHLVTVISPGDVAFSDLVFSSVEVADVRAGISTSMEDEDIQALIEEAAEAVQGALLDECGFDTATMEEIDPSIRTAVIRQARILVLGHDASAGLRISSIQEGSERIVLEGRKSSDLDRMQSSIDGIITRFCKRKTSLYLPYAEVHDRPVPRDLDAPPWHVPPDGQHW